MRRGPDFGLGLKLVSATRLRSHVGCLELCLGGLLDVFQTHLGWVASWHVVPNWHTLRQEVKAWPAWAELLGQPD